MQNKNKFVNNNFNNLKDFKDTNNTKNWKFHVVWTECHYKICFLKQLLTKYLETSMKLSKVRFY